MIDIFEAILIALVCPFALLVDRKRMMINKF